MWFSRCFGYCVTKSFDQFFNKNDPQSFPLVRPFDSSPIRLRSCSLLPAPLRVLQLYFGRQSR